LFHQLTHSNFKQISSLTLPKLLVFNRAIKLSSWIKELSIAVSFGTITTESFLSEPFLD